MARKGRRSRPRIGGIAARERVPDPRTRPMSTCWAWSSRLCPRRTTAAPRRSATSVIAAYRAWRASDSGPPPVATTVMTRVSTGASPRPAHAVAAARAASADPGWSWWSMTTAPARSPARGATQAAASASANESAPPEQATRTTAFDGRSARQSRTAARVARRALSTIAAASHAAPTRRRDAEHPGA